MCATGKKYEDRGPKVPLSYVSESLEKGPSCVVQPSSAAPHRLTCDEVVPVKLLVTPVAYASFEIFTLVLDDRKLQGYQVRNGELSFTVDRQILPPGPHTLAVHEKQKGSTRTDVQTFEFTIIDALR